MRLIRERQVNPELLDRLPVDDPRAIHSRHDLRRINTVMMHARIISRALVRYCKASPRNIIDLGSGDGTLMLKIARRFSPGWRNVCVVLLDHQNIVSTETRDRFSHLQWHVEPLGADVFDFLRLSPAMSSDAIIANLFLHHFDDRHLKCLLEHAAKRTSLFFACEPRRGNAALLLSAMTWAIGANGVTRHDAVASVCAGFRGRELSSLWPKSDRWWLREWAATPLSHCFVAVRTSTSDGL
jgi:hypothetical protein